MLWLRELCSLGGSAACVNIANSTQRRRARGGYQHINSTSPVTTTNYSFAASGFGASFFSPSVFDSSFLGSSFLGSSFLGSSFLGSSFLGSSFLGSSFL